MRSLLGEHWSWWALAPIAVLLAVDRRLKLTGGRAFALYVMLYTAGRFWIEQLRIDTVNHLGPFRLNVWTSIVVFLLALAFFVATRKREVPGEAMLEPAEPVAADRPDAGSTS